MKSNSNNQASSQLDGRANPPQNAFINPFIQMSIKFDFSFNNLQSFNLLIQPFDIQFDPAVISDMICYFYDLFNGIKFKLRDRIVCFQTFNIYPIIINLSCKNLPKRTYHFTLNKYSPNLFHFKDQLPDFRKLNRDYSNDKQVKLKHQSAPQFAKTNSNELHKSKQNQTNQLNSSKQSNSNQHKEVNANPLMQSNSEKKSKTTDLNNCALNSITSNQNYQSNREIDSQSNQTKQSNLDATNQVKSKQATRSHSNTISQLNSSQSSRSNSNEINESTLNQINQLNSNQNRQSNSNGINQINQLNINENSQLNSSENNQSNRQCKLTLNLNNDSNLNDYDLFDNYIYFNCDNLSILKNILIHGVSEKRCCIGFSSITLNDVNMRLATLIDILTTHFSYFSKSAIEYMTGLIYNEMPQIKISRCEASAASIEFYRPAGQLNLFKNQVIKQKIDKGENELNLSLYFDSDTSINLKTYLALNGRLPKFTSIEVYPVFSNDINAVIEYHNSNLIIPDLSIQNNHEILYLSPMNQIDSSFIDRFDLGKVVSKQKKFVSNKIVPLTNEQINLQVIIQKNYCHDNEVIRFLELTRTVGTIVALTDSSLLIFAAPSLNLISKFELINITGIDVNKNRAIISFKKSKKLKNKNALMIDFNDEAVASQMKLIIKTILIKQNVYVI